jgi:hypothetical protein
MNEQAALKGVNEERTAFLDTALLHGRCGLVVRTQMRTAQRGSIPFAWASTSRATKGWSSLPAAGLTCHFTFWPMPAA